MSGKQIRFAADRELWERQPGESEKQYARFAMYRDLGRARTLTQAAEMLTVGQRITYGQLRNVASTFRWSERAGSWDREQDRIFLAQLAAKRRELMHREATVANRTLRHVIDRLTAITPDELKKMDLYQTARTGDMAFKWLRDAFGVPAGTTLAATVAADAAAASTATVDDDAASDADQLRELAKLHEENASYLRMLADSDIYAGPDSGVDGGDE